jgi:phosphoribosylformylglycinamidine synthase
VIRIRGTDRAIAVKTDCNGRYVYLEPNMGGRIAVAEAARNVACTGARPMAITNCLNFGNPTRPEVFHQFREAVRGMGEACEALGTPVTGGNVSFYNENPDGAVYPTPVVGMVGLVESLAHVTRSTFRQDGDAIVLLGEPTDELGGSEYLAHIHGIVAGAPPRCNLDRERSVIEALLDAIRAGHVRSAHDCSEGGLAVAIAESAIGDRTRMTGADLDLSAFAGLPLRALLFGEAQGRVVVSTPEPARVLAAAERRGVPAARIGTVRVGSDRLRFTIGDRTILASLRRLGEAFHNTIPAIMGASPAEVAVLEQHPSVATV